jgi:hypothetical protein
VELMPETASSLRAISLQDITLVAASVGISGVRHPLNAAQRDLFRNLIAVFRPVDFGAEQGVMMHHGACTGADSEAHTAGCVYGFDITLHPASNTGQWHNGYLKPQGRGVQLERHASYVRNRQIVAAADVLIVAPLYPEAYPQSLRSGTWQTIRYARKKGIPVYYAMLNGYLFEEVPA